MTFREIFQKELRSSAFLLIVLPIILAIIFCFTYYKNVINYQPTVVFDADNTTVSRQVINAYDLSNRFDIQFYVDNLEAFEDKLKQNDAYVGVYIPPHFTRDIKRGIPTSIGIVVNATNVIFGNGAITASKEINLSALVNGGQKLIQATGQPPDEALRTAYPIQFKLRVLNNPTNSYSNFMLLGLIINGMQLAIYLAATAMLCREYSNMPLLSSTTSGLNIIAAKFAACWLSATFALCICEILANLICAVPFRAPVWQISILNASFTFLVTAVCFFFSSFLKNPVTAVQTPLLYMMPGLLYSGLSWPLGWVDPVPAFLSKLLPRHYFAVPLRLVSLRGFSPDFVPSVAQMLSGGIILLIFAGFFFRYNRTQLLRQPLQGGEEQ